MKKKELGPPRVTSYQVQLTSRSPSNTIWALSAEHNSPCSFHHSVQTQNTFWHWRLKRTASMVSGWYIRLEHQLSRGRWCDFNDQIHELPLLVHLVFEHLRVNFSSSVWSTNVEINLQPNHLHVILLIKGKRFFFPYKFAYFCFKDIQLFRIDFRPVNL